MSARNLVSTLALFLAGCANAAQGGYPSLARRPIESRDFDAEVARAEEARKDGAPADAELMAKIQKLSDQAMAGGAAFDRDYPGAQKLVRAAAGKGLDSDPWVDAQVALSGLEASRNDSVSALASLDTLYVEQMNAAADGKADGGTKEIAQARGSALAIVDSQNDRLDALKGVLKQP